MPAANSRVGASLHGVLVLDKPVGITSAAVVAVVKRIADGAKTGHAGTLDPLASGVLLLAIGRATTVVSALVGCEKRYRTTVNLSAFSETDDEEGAKCVVHVPAPARSTVLDAIRRFHGTIRQRPPAYSAVKVKGRRAYAIARAGGVPAIEEREVVVRSLRLIRYAWPRVELDVHCGKGFYVRSLARDLGVALGTGGFCESIRRTAVGPFTVSSAMQWSTLPSQIEPGLLLSVSQAMAWIDHSQGLAPIDDSTV